MNRLCIFATYDCYGIVDEYIGYLLKKLKAYVDSLIAVCNYEYINNGSENIIPYADKIFFRKNIGFDAGAYKDAICRYIGWDEIYKYDEVLLVNDSFYGPLYSFSELFYKMDKAEADYWGITRSPSGMIKGQAYSAHIQSYFVAFRKKVLQCNGFRDYWEKLPYPNTLYQAVLGFEIGCNKLLMESGFRGIALTDLYNMSRIFKNGENPYLMHSLELIHDIRVPILKRKCLDFINKGYKNALDAFNYIEKEKLYNVEYIKKHISRVNQSLKCQGAIDFHKLESFYFSHTRVYIYGAGIFGKNIAMYFEYRGWEIGGFLVTDTKNQMNGCIAFDEADIGADEGVIIAAGNKDVFLEILEKVESYCSRDQIFCPNYII